MKIKMGINKKLGILIFFLMLIFGTVLILVLGQIILNGFKKTAEDLSKPSIKLGAFYINSFMDSFVTQAKIISQKQNISLILNKEFINTSKDKKIIDKNITDINELSNELKSYMNDNELIINIILIDTNFNVLVSADKVGSQMLKVDESVKKTNNIIFNEPLWCEVHKTFELTLYSPVFYKNEKNGYLLYVIDWEKFQNQTTRMLKILKTGYLYILNKNGILMLHQKSEKMLNDISNYDFIREMIAKKEGNIFYLFEGVTKYVAYEKLKYNDWIIAVTFPEVEVLTYAYQAITNEIIIIVISTIVLLILVTITLNILLKPVNIVSLDLSDGARNLESVSFQVSSASQELSSSASELASSVEEISSSLEELQSVIEANTKNINQSEIMMKETNEGSKNVTTKMNEMQSALIEINENSKKIVKIIKVIDDIAFQTNILALNAAVEAARAGDAGRGFAVVADQVKTLAQKSAEAAKETAELIEIAIESVTNGESLGKSVMEVQLRAGEMSEKVSTLLDEVNRASKEQMKGINQITQAVTQTNTVVQQSASSSEEIAASGEELYTQAETLNNIVDKLNVIVKGKKIVKTKKTEEKSVKLLPENID